MTWYKIEVEGVEYHSVSVFVVISCEERAGLVQSSTQLVDVELVAWKVKCASFSKGGFLGYINIKNVVCLIVLSASLHLDIIRLPVSTSYE